MQKPHESFRKIDDSLYDIKDLNARILAIIWPFLVQGTQAGSAITLGKRPPRRISHDNRLHFLIPQMKALRERVIAATGDLTKRPIDIIDACTGSGDIPIAASQVFQPGEIRHIIANEADRSLREKFTQNAGILLPRHTLEQLEITGAHWEAPEFLDLKDQNTPSITFFYGNSLGFEDHETRSDLQTSLGRITTPDSFVSADTRNYNNALREIQASVTQVTEIRPNPQRFLSAEATKQQKERDAANKKSFWETNIAPHLPIWLQSPPDDESINHLYPGSAVKARPIALLNKIGGEIDSATCKQLLGEETHGAPENITGSLDSIQRDIGFIVYQYDLELHKLNRRVVAAIARELDMDLSDKKVLSAGLQMHLTGVSALQEQLNKHLRFRGLSNNLGPNFNHLRHSNTTPVVTFLHQGKED